jgi:hypothetical protein
LSHLKPSEDHKCVRERRDLGGEAVQEGCKVKRGMGVELAGAGERE